MTKPNDDRSAPLGINPGAGAIKIYGAAGGIQLPSTLAPALRFGASAGVALLTHDVPEAVGRLLEVYASCSKKKRQN